MATAGYSGTPLRKKLGLKKEYRVRLLHQPADYFKWLEADISGQAARGHEVPDWVHLFASSRAVYEKEMRSLAGVWKANPKVIIWVSWYKKSSGIATDLTEDGVRGYALKNGLVDI